MKNIFKKISFIQLALDLMIVFIGVTLAFLFTNYHEQKKEEKEIVQVLSLVNAGLERYGVLFDGMIKYHQKYNQHFRNQLEDDNTPNFDGVTFLSPAYPINAMSRLTDQGYHVLNSKIYMGLTAFSNGIQRLMYIEQKLVDISEKSMIIRRSDFQNLGDYFFERKKWAKQYLIYLERRKNTLIELQNKNHNIRQLLSELYPIKIDLVLKSSLEELKKNPFLNYEN